MKARLEQLDQDEVREKLEQSLKLLLTEDLYLLQIDINERSITHRLAVHLGRLFEGWKANLRRNERVAAEQHW